MVSDDVLFGPVTAAPAKPRPVATRESAPALVPTQAIDPYAWALGNRVIDEQVAASGKAMAIDLGDTVLVFKRGIVGPLTPEQVAQYAAKPTKVTPTEADGARIRLLFDATAEIPADATIEERLQRIRAALEAQGVRLL